jgi:serine O-acetyltransferase
LNESKPELWSKLLIWIYSYGNKIRYSIDNKLVRRILLVPYVVLDFIVVRGFLNCLFSYQIKTGKGMKIWHPYGIVVHSGVVLGDNLTIRQQVTIGKAHENGGVPKIGNNVSIGAGAKIIGEIEIGDNTQIGTNAVVTKSFPPNAILVGVPARNINEEEG